MGLPELIAPRAVPGAWLMLLLWGAPAEPLVPPQRHVADYELTWSAPAGCPDTEEIRTQIEAMAQIQPDAAGTMEVRAVVTAAAGAYVLDLETELDGQLDTRTLRAERCRTLADSAALVVALSIDPHAQSKAGTAVAPTHPVAAAAEPAVAPQEEPPKADTLPLTSAEPSPADLREAPREGSRDDARGDERRAPRRSPSRRPQALALRTSAMAEFGLLPRWSGGPLLGAVALWEHWTLEARGSFVVGRPTARRSGARGRMRLGAGAARGCWRARVPGSVEFPLCAVLEAGRARAVSEGLEPSTTLYFAHIAPGVGAGIAVRRARLGFVTGAEAVFPLQRAGVNVGETRVFTSRPASIRGFVALEIFFQTDPA